LLLLEGKPREALDASSRLETEEWRHIVAALAQHSLGHEQESLAALVRLRVSPLVSGYSVQVAQLHAFRGERDSAFEWLDRAYANRDPGMMQLKVDRSCAS